MGLTEWNGNAIRERIIAAAVIAVDETTEAAAKEAEADHWWENRTDQLEHETVNEPARVEPHAVAGRFGTTERRGFYGLFLEYKHPFLRPVAGRVFPTLAARLREHLL